MLQTTVWYTSMFTTDTSTRTAVLLACLYLVPQAFASENPIRILLPVFVNTPVEGAHGSRWRSDLALTNTSDMPLPVDPILNGCRITGCGIPEIAPGTTVFPQVMATTHTSPTAFLFVPESRVNDLVPKLRIRDESRSALSWGTEVPVVPETKAYAGRFQLVDVPVGVPFRTLIRVYGFAESEKGVILRFFKLNPGQHDPLDTEPDELLHEMPLALRPAPVQPDNELKPSYAQLMIDQIPELAGAERLRVEIEPVTPGIRYWALASITNNVTQQVTLVSP